MRGLNNGSKKQGSWSEISNGFIRGRAYLLFEKGFTFPTDLALMKQATKVQDEDQLYDRFFTNFRVTKVSMPPTITMIKTLVHSLAFS